MRKSVAVAAAVVIILGAIGSPDRARAEPPRRTHRAAGLEIAAEGDLKGFALELKPARVAEGLEIVTIRLTSPAPQPPPRFTLKWSLPSHDVVGQWATGRQMNKTIHPDWSGGRLTASMFAREAPVSCLFGSDDGNVLTFAVSDALDTVLIIVDDGWQTLDSARGYAYTGDWQPERMPDMKGFVDAGHALGVKVVLWYAVPFVGKNAKAAGRFKDRSLRYEDRLGAYVLDPRYREVREYLVEIYRRAIRDWGIDGFMWHDGERVEIAAFQLLNVLFSVPQVSVRLQEIPKDHFAMVQFYTSYWRENRPVLLEGACRWSASGRFNRPRSGPRRLRAAPRRRDARAGARPRRPSGRPGWATA